MNKVAFETRRNLQVRAPTNQPTANYSVLLLLIQGQDSTITVMFANHTGLNKHSSLSQGISKHRIKQTKQNKNVPADGISGVHSNGINVGNGGRRPSTVAGTPNGEIVIESFRIE